MDPIKREVERELAGRAHAGAFKNPKRAAMLNGHHIATEYRHQESGSPEVRDFKAYLRNAEEPQRLLAHLAVEIADERLGKIGKTQLIGLYRNLLLTEKNEEAVNTTLDLTPNASWMDRAESSERDAAHDATKSAIERRMAAMRVKDNEVWAQ